MKEKYVIIKTNTLGMKPDVDFYESDAKRNSDFQSQKALMKTGDFLYKAVITGVAKAVAEIKITEENI